MSRYLVDRVLANPKITVLGGTEHGSMKRVAAAVGEDASAVRSMHNAIGIRA